MTANVGWGHKIILPTALNETIGASGVNRKQNQLEMVSSLFCEWAKPKGHNSVMSNISFPG